MGEQQGTTPLIRALRVLYILSFLLDLTIVGALIGIPLFLVLWAMQYIFINQANPLFVFKKNKSEAISISKFKNMIEEETQDVLNLFIDEIKGINSDLIFILKDTIAQRMQDNHIRFIEAYSKKLISKDKIDYSGSIIRLNVLYWSIVDILQGLKIWDCIDQYTRAQIGEPIDAITYIINNDLNKEKVTKYGKPSSIMFDAFKGYIEEAMQKAKEQGFQEDRQADQTITEDEAIELLTRELEGLSEADKQSIYDALDDTKTKEQ
jgi:hypothetical protein